MSTGTPRIAISVHDSSPWPSLAVSVEIGTESGASPLHSLPQRETQILLSNADPLDGLLLRTLMRQPLGEFNRYIAGSRDFASMLALLRQHSDDCVYAESPRVADLEILSEPAEACLDIEPLAEPRGTRSSVASPSSDDLPQISVRAQFCCPESGRALGRPLCRGSAYWVFERCIAPEPELPRDSIVRAAFERAAGETLQLSGEEALELIDRAQQSPKARLHPSLKEIKVCGAPRPALSVDAAGKGRLEANWFFEAQSNGERAEAVEPVELLAAAARGKRYIRRGNTYIRVDRESVQCCRKTIEKIAPLQGSSLELHDEQIPELLAWAKDNARLTAEAQSRGEDEFPIEESLSLSAPASNDPLRAPASPWNIYVAAAVDGAHIVKDEAATVRLRLDVEEEDGDTWFTLEPSFDHSGEELTEAQLRKLVAAGKKWFRKGNAWIKIDDEALKRFEHGVRRTGIRRRRGFRGPSYCFTPAARERVTDIFSLSSTIEHAERYGKFLEQLRSFERIDSLPMPNGFKLKLRPYQHHGFEWMYFLARYGLNGILADDMGLGKTAQTIALLARMKEEHGDAPCLIVAPTSLLDNWRSEFVKFCPDLRVMIYRGSIRRRDVLRAEIGAHDVVLGTYATVRNDASLLREIAWRYIILDEAHFIKNSAAATTKAIKTIPARHRLALTGTPIQNRLTELWSLFDFLMPEFLGRQARFRDHFEEPIAAMQSGAPHPTLSAEEQRQRGEDALASLREKIRPFVLRRLKSEVARDLPAKIENDIFCTLCPEQTALYKGFSDSEEAKSALNEISTKGADRACTAILAALMSLRKICNHADLMCLPVSQGRKKIAAPLPGFEQRSGKLEALGELLQQCREGGHRALIFCQLTSMLDLVEHYLNGCGISFLRLDGQTPAQQRKGLVDRFNADESLGAFLISTRAGGAGLNLTGADTVIFYDHDWNPANDQQAQDRAYRIGQKRVVNVYRLICRGTLEEKILRRQTQKKLLASSIVSGDLGTIKDLTRDELLSLFTLTTEPVS